MDTLELLKGLADPTRLRIMKLLVTRRGELCVCHLTGALALPQSTISRHLSILRKAQLVTTRREGKWMHYAISSAVPPELIDLLKKSSRRDPTLAADKSRLDESVACN